MKRTHFELVIKLLLSGGAVGAAVPMPACQGQCPDTVVEPEPYDLPEDAQIFGATDDGVQYAVGGGGVVMELLTGGQVYRPVEVDLRAVAVTDELVIVAGAGGVVATAAIDSGDWQVIDIGTTADLWGATPDADRRTLIVGDGVMFSRDANAGMWTAVAPPEGGWGELRAVYSDWRGVLAVGRGGVIWFATSMHGPWQREDVGTDADLTSVYNGLVGGADGLVLARDQTGAWAQRAIDSTATVIDVYPAVLTAAGELFEITGDGTAVVRTRLTDPVAGAHAVTRGDDGTYIVLGEAGAQRQVGRCVRYTL